MIQVHKGYKVTTPTPIHDSIAVLLSPEHANNDQQSSKISITEGPLALFVELLYCLCASGGAASFETVAPASGLPLPPFHLTIKPQGA